MLAAGWGACLPCASQFQFYSRRKKEMAAASVAIPVPYTIEFGKTEVVHGKATTIALAAAAIRRIVADYLTEKNPAPVRAMIFAEGAWEELTVDTQSILRGIRNKRIEQELIYRLTDVLTARISHTYEALPATIREKYEFVDGDAYNAGILNFLRQNPDPTDADLKEFLIGFVAAPTGN